MPPHRSVLILPLLFAMGVSPAIAQDKARSPAALQKVLDCRSLSDDKERLACFDAGVAQLDRARADGDLAVVDREEVRRTRRGLFGFSLPSLAIFSSNRDKDPRGAAMEDELKEITGKIQAVSVNGSGGFIVTLEDGARWEQTDSVTLGRSPRPGGTATIKRGALGSYKMSFGVGPAVKARRIG